MSNTIVVGTAFVSCTRPMVARLTGHVRAATSALSEDSFQVYVDHEFVVIVKGWARFFVDVLVAAQYLCVARGLVDAVKDQQLSLDRHAHLWRKAHEARIVTVIAVRGVARTSLFLHRLLKSFFF